MAQVHAKLREVLDTDVVLVELFKYPTVGSLAQHLAQRREQSPRRSLAEQTDERVRKRREVISRRRPAARGV
jgi:hypothetical protein